MSRGAYSAEQCLEHFQERIANKKAPITICPISEDMCVDLFFILSVCIVMGYPYGVW